MYRADHCRGVGGLVEILGREAALFWKEWPFEMEVKALGGVDQNSFSMSGTCPHCNRQSVFIMVTPAHAGQIKNEHNQVTMYELWAVMQCQGCLQYILGGAKKSVSHPGQPYRYSYIAHYPLGKPDDSLPSEIPENIAADFSEALRCRFVEAYNATVEMCRRAIQASCIQLRAPNDKLVKQIDWLAQQGIITSPLKEMAHRIRLGGNLGAHPPEDPDNENAIVIGPEYADAVIEFTRDFFQHVYVMPERLKKFTFSTKRI